MSITNTERRILAAKLFGDDRSGGWRHFEVEETQLGDGGGGGGGGGFKIDFRLRVRETNSVRQVVVIEKRGGIKQAKIVQV